MSPDNDGVNVAKFTAKQGSYLSYIQAYLKLHGQPPAFADIGMALGVTPPSVNQMVKELERKKLIRRIPGQARSIEILVPADEIPQWIHPDAEQRQSKTEHDQSAAMYLLSVYLENGAFKKRYKNNQLRRDIEIRGDQTLDDLHEEIFIAFDRYDEHLYEFQFGQKPNERGAPTFGFTDMIDWYRADSRDTTLDSLKLKPDRVFGYLFDFGDNWYHHIKVQQIGQADPTVQYPRVIERVGKSPPQYPEDKEEE